MRKGVLSNLRMSLSHADFNCCSKQRDLEVLEYNQRTIQTCKQLMPQYIYLPANFTVLERSNGKLDSFKNKCSLFTSAREQKNFFPSFATRSCCSGPSACFV